MKKVADILTRKGAHVTTIPPQASVLQALQLMADENIGSVVVVDEGRFAGIMTERDYSRKVVLKGRSSTDTPVAEIMSTGFPHVSPQDSVEHCMQLLAQKNIRYLPVFVGNELSGILSINDLVKETILAQQETITHLQDYLHTSL